MKTIVNLGVIVSARTVLFWYLFYKTCFPGENIETNFGIVLKIVILKCGAILVTKYFDVVQFIYDKNRIIFTQNILTKCRIHNTFNMQL